MRGVRPAPAERVSFAAPTWRFPTPADIAAIDANYNARVESFTPAERQQYDAGVATLEQQKQEYWEREAALAVAGPLSDAEKSELADLGALERSGDLAYDQRLRLDDLQIRYSEELREIRIAQETRSIIAERLGKVPVEDGWTAAWRRLQRDRVKVSVYRIRVSRQLSAVSRPASTRAPRSRSRSSRRVRARAPTRARRSADDESDPSDLRVA